MFCRNDSFFLLQYPLVRPPARSHIPIFLKHHPGKTQTKRPVRYTQTYVEGGAGDENYKIYAVTSAPGTPSTCVHSPQRPRELSSPSGRFCSPERPAERRPARARTHLTSTPTQGETTGSMWNHPCGDTKETGVISSQQSPCSSAGVDDGRGDNDVGGGDGGRTLTAQRLATVCGRGGSSSGSSTAGCSTPIVTAVVQGAKMSELSISPAARSGSRRGNGTTPPLPRPSPSSAPPSPSEKPPRALADGIRPPFYAQSSSLSSPPRPLSQQTPSPSPPRSRNCVGGESAVGGRPTTVVPRARPQTSGGRTTVGKHRSQASATTWFRVDVGGGGDGSRDSGGAGETGKQQRPYESEGGVSDTALKPHSSARRRRAPSVSLSPSQLRGQELKTKAATGARDDAVEGGSGGGAASRMSSSSITRRASSASLTGKNTAARTANVGAVNPTVLSPKDTGWRAVRSKT